MIINFLLNIVVLILNVIFGWLPEVITLPTIVGYDIDGALVSGVGQLRFFFSSFWAIGYMFSGFLVIIGYYVMKATLKLFLGARAPD